MAGKSGIAAFVVPLVVSAAACGTSTDTQFVHSEQVSKSTFEGTWPLTRDSGVLACDSSKSDAVTFTPGHDTKTYAVNKGANGWAPKEGWAEANAIWSGDDWGDFIGAGLKLCGWVTYTTFGEEPFETLNLYPYKGSKMAILANSDSLDATTMSKWLRAMDGAYSFYASATGREPDPLEDTLIDGLSTIARVDATCGAGCGHMGTTGIEILNNYFDEFYDRLKEYGQFGQIPFYELGRNFWFYDDQLNYKDVPGGPEPADIPTGYAVFMRFMSMQYLELEGAPFGDLDFNEFLGQIRRLRDDYLANGSLTWANTLGVGEGIDGWGATDLFASFCFYLEENYGGMNWVQNVWRYAGERPDAETTQDAVDNFIIVASEAAETNLVPLFETWRWPISQAASDYLGKLLPA